MIDNLIQAVRLLEKLQDALPLPALMTPRLAAFLRERYPDRKIAERCRIVGVDYAGEEGGIMCELDVGLKADGDRFIVSITHLAFDRSHPLRRAIVAYQKHRTKRLRAFDRAAVHRTLAMRVQTYVDPS